MDTCKTITVETENGPVTINEDDFDPSQHKVAGAAPTTKPPRKKASRKQADG